MTAFGHSVNSHNKSLWNMHQSSPCNSNIAKNFCTWCRAETPIGAHDAPSDPLFGLNGMCWSVLMLTDMAPELTGRTNDFKNTYFSCGFVASVLSYSLKNMHWISGFESNIAIKILLPNFFCCRPLSRSSPCAIEPPPSQDWKCWSVGALVPLPILGPWLCCWLPITVSLLC